MVGITKALRLAALTLGFGSPSDNIAGMLRYDEANKRMILGTVEGTAAGNLRFVVGNETTAMTIDANQNVGIGSTSPTALLHIQKGSSSDTDFTNTNRQIILAYDGEHYDWCKLPERTTVEDLRKSVNKYYNLKF